MEYIGLNEIMDEVRGMLEATGLFRLVTKGAITGAENLFLAIPELSEFPAAIVNCPPQRFPQPVAWRELALEIILVDEFLPLSMEEKAASACALLDGVVAKVTGTEPGKSLCMACGANLMLEDIMALAVDSQHTAWLVETRVISKIKA
jgi:hypothetical protein